jgi:hypothetical protein
VVLGALATAALGILGYKNREIAVWHSGIEKLDSKRKAVARVKLQLVGPLIDQTHESYETMKNFRKKTEETGDSLKGVFEEDPLGNFEDHSSKLQLMLDECASWANCLQRERRKLRIAGWLNDSGFITVILMLVTFVLEVDVLVPIILGVLTLCVSVSAIIILGFHRSARDSLLDEWDKLSDKEDRFFVD